MVSLNQKRGGIVGDLINGTGGLIILTIITLVIVSTLLGANLLGGQDTTTLTTTNETNAWLNATPYTLASVNASNSAYAITAIWGAEGGLYNVSIPIANATVSAAGVVTNATVYTNANVSYTYTYTYSTDNTYVSTTDNMAANFTSGIDNVSIKIPTILLIAAVVLLFGVLVLLVGQSRKMGVGGGGGSSL